VINGLSSRFTPSSLRASAGVQRTNRFAGLALGCATCVVLPACWSPSGIFGPPTTAPDCSSYSWIVIPLSNAEPLVIDPGATPPQARLKEGQRTLVRLISINQVPTGCNVHLTFSAWVSSNPAIASIGGAPTNDIVPLTALSAGDTLIFVEGVLTPAGPVRAQLAYCPDHTGCVPVNLVLRVVP
jgi:hypothetical protein